MLHGCMFSFPRPLIAAADLFSMSLQVCKGGHLQDLTRANHLRLLIGLFTENPGQWGASGLFFRSKLEEAACTSRPVPWSESPLFYALETVSIFVKGFQGLASSLPSILAELFLFMKQTTWKLWWDLQWPCSLSWILRLTFSLWLKGQSNTCHSYRRFHLVLGFVDFVWFLHGMVCRSYLRRWIR